MVHTPRFRLQCRYISGIRVCGNEALGSNLGIIRKGEALRVLRSSILLPFLGSMMRRVLRSSRT